MSTDENTGISPKKSILSGISTFFSKGSEKIKEKVLYQLNNQS